MRLLKIALVYFLIFFINSCQKDFTLTDPGTSTGPTVTTDSTTSKIKTYTEDVTEAGEHTVITYDLTYDNSNRITTLVSETNAGDKFVYGYNNVYTLDIYNSGALSIHNQFFLNSNSFVDSAFQYNDTQDTTTDKYFYNSSKQLIKDITYDVENGVPSIDDITEYTYDANGNVIIESDDNGTYTYDYYTDQINNIMLLPFFPNGNKNVVKTTTFDDGSGDVIVFHHAYVFDSKNRVTSDTATDASGDVSIKSYTYY